MGACPSRARSDARGACGANGRNVMRRRIRRPARRTRLFPAAGVVIIAIAVPPFLVVNGFRVLANDWFVSYELGRDGFPPDRYGLRAAERLELARVGLRSIQPGSDGIVLLERATLPDGSTAFNERELRHMSDVRVLLGAALRAQLAAFLVLVVLAFLLARSARWRGLVPRGLLSGAVGTLAVAAVTVPVILLGFDGFFVRFHGLFFAGDTWRFADDDTLLRLYPEVFWQHTAQLAAALAVSQAVVVAALSGWWLRRLRARSRDGS